MAQQVGSRPVEVIHLVGGIRREVAQFSWQAQTYDLSRGDDGEWYTVDIGDTERFVSSPGGADIRHQGVLYRPTITRNPATGCPLR